MTVRALPPSISAGGIVVVEALPDTPSANYTYEWAFSGGAIEGFQRIEAEPGAQTVRWDTTGLRASSYTVRVAVFDNGQQIATNTDTVTVTPAQIAVSTSIQRTSLEPTADIGLWMAIRRSARALGFESYNQAIESLLASVESGGGRGMLDLLRRRSLPFNDTDAYHFLKVATEAFLVVSTGVVLSAPNYFTQEDVDEAGRRLNGRGANVDLDQLRRYLVPSPSGGPGSPNVRTLPYLALVRRKLRDVGLRRLAFGEAGTSDDMPQEFDGILEEKLTAPLLLELIWSYWQEEGMLVQTMNAISRRFQNIRGPHERDPLASFETEPLRPLNNLLWGYIQDEQHRLTMVRRAYEYDHHYGISLYGKAVPQIRTADSRSKFIEAFHNLLSSCTSFFIQEDDAMVFADGFPVLNALKEVHLLLTQGAHNQYGDLPATARQEMLLQQWLLARPEFREFLPTRIMVAYPEPWMDRVDAMKQVQGWTGSSVLHFHNLAVYGEQILLGARYGAWSAVNESLQAANWARYWRPEIQGYIHAYRAVTGVDLATEVTDTRQNGERYLQPSVHLTRQLAQERRGRLPAPAPSAAPAPRRRLPNR